MYGSEEVRKSRTRMAAPSSSPLWRIPPSSDEQTRFQSPGRRRRSRFVVTPSLLPLRIMSHPLAALVFFASAVFRIAEACSSRSTPKPRPPSQNARPNITFPTFECPNEYRSFYCLNGARCFTVKIENNVLYNCECADGFTGPRCEFKDLDGSYLPNREKVMIETASIAGGVTVAVLLIVIIFIAIYVYVRRREKVTKMETSTVDGSWKPFERRPQCKTSLQQSREKASILAGPCRTGVTTADPEAGDHRLLGSHLSPSYPLRPSLTTSL